MNRNGAFVRWVMMGALACWAGTAAGMPRIEPGLRDACVFLFHNENGKDLVGHGTGFLVSLENPAADKEDACYLVTARHVLFLDNKPLASLGLRLNKIGGNTEMRKIDMTYEGDKRNVWFAGDGADAAIVRIDRPDPAVYAVTLLGPEMILTRQMMAELQIAEGSEMFFCGMLIHHVGAGRNEAQLRFGRLSMIATEKVNWEGGKHDLYLADVAIFGGSSGSPAFFAWYQDGDETAGGKSGFKLGGIMIGGINIKTGDVVNNSGISAITPAYKIYEILYSEPVKANRGF